nr:Pycsar system effector family protein [Streptomyces olivoverticillatus]
MAGVQEQIRNANFLGATILGASITGAGIAVPLLVDRAHSTLLHQPVVVVVPAVAGVVAIVAALWQLLNVVLPRLDGFATRANFLHYATTAPDRIPALIAAGDPAAETRVLSRIATDKYRALGRAGRLLKTAIVLLNTAAVLALSL